MVKTIQVNSNERLKIIKWNKWKFKSTYSFNKKMSILCNWVQNYCKCVKYDPRAIIVAFQTSSGNLLEMMHIIEPVATDNKSLTKQCLKTA